MHELPLRTPSLVLRQFTPQDAEPMRRLNGEPSTRRWLPSHVYADAAEARAALAFLIAAYSHPGDPRDGPYVLGVAQANDGQLLGHVGFSPLYGEVEVSYAIAESARGRGLGTEALSCACAWAGRVFGLTGLVAITATDNIPSRRVLERAGFHHVRDEDMRFQGVPQAVSRYGLQVHGPRGDARPVS